MRNISVLVIGSGSTAAAILRSLTACAGVQVAALVDAAAESPARAAALQLQVDVLPHWRKVQSPVDVIIETTGAPELRTELKRDLPRSTSLIEGPAVTLLAELLKRLSRFEQTGQFSELLAAALEVIHEGVEIADSGGIIRYVNPAFSSILALPPADRIERSVFDVSPDGGIAQVLHTGIPVGGIRNRPQGTDVEVVSNASPIYRDGALVGGVSVFRDTTDLLRLSQELQRNMVLIESLYDEIGALNPASYEFRDLVGDDPALAHAVEVARRTAASDSTVLIEGETGTGKEILAHAIHNASPRKQRAFIKINSSAIPESLLESEFFGYERGAFSGAHKRKPGKLELANGGTLFLDEVGDMSPALQAKILRVLQDKEFQRVGGSESVKVDVRIVAATNANLAELIEKELFRRDLYYRLNVVSVKLPPLRQRAADIPLLAAHLIDKLCRRLGRRVSGITPEAGALLAGYDWPGNVREMENLLERVINVVDGDLITEQALLAAYPALTGEKMADMTAIMPLEQAERMLIRKAMNTYGDSLEGKKKAAEALGISLSTLYNKIRSGQLQ